jgi:hypothetical protein
MILDEQYINDLIEYLKSGQLAEDFEHSSEERRYEILDFLEKVMDLGEIADEVATKIIFKNSQLEAFLNPKSQK